MRKNKNAWFNELNNVITSYEQLIHEIELKEDEEAAFRNGLSLPFAITPHILRLIKSNDSSGAIRRQYIPNYTEHSKKFNHDFLKESENEVAPGLIQRYPHKAILVVTQACPAYCRFCTRSRIVGRPTLTDISSALEYIENHNEIYDIVITGGDPLILCNEELREIFEKIRKIESVSILRLNTRIPVNLPNRIDSKLIKLLKNNRVFVNIHFEHPDEISEKTKEVCLKMADNGIVLGSQSVLLKGINDDEETLKKLFLELLKIKVKPYYLYQCDKVCGCENFYLPPETGANLINRLAPQLPGIAVPKFVVDVPGKVGKSCIAPYGLVRQNFGEITFKNFFTNVEETYETETTKE